MMAIDIELLIKTILLAVFAFSAWVASLMGGVLANWTWRRKHPIPK